MQVSCSDVEEKHTQGDRSTQVPALIALVSLVSQSTSNDVRDHLKQLRSQWAASVTHTGAGVGSAWQQVSSEFEQLVPSMLSSSK